MIFQVFRAAFVSIGIGFFVELANGWLHADFMQKFFEGNLITILIALLAINATTMGIVLTKIRDLIDRNGGGVAFFEKTRYQMLLSVKEQIGLIVIATILLSIKSSSVISDVQNLPLFLNSIITGVFVYALMVLYDTAKGVLIIVDYEGGQ